MTPDALWWGGMAAIIAYVAWGRFAGKTSSSGARAMVASGARLLDVRTPGEFAGGHLPGAVNIPLGELSKRTSEVGGPESAVVVYCLSGMRSGQAARLLKQAGFRQVADLGAMSRW